MAALKYTPSCEYLQITASQTGINIVFTKWI